MPRGLDNSNPLGLVYTGMNKIFISCKESRIENNRSFYGCFYLGPFEASQSLTVANALRRTLLSECTGLGITSVIIENVHHEYSTLPNVRDSVLDILLNLKEIVLKKVSNPWNFYQNQGLNSLYEEVGSSYFKPVTGYLKVKGPGVIRAKNLRLPPFIQCVDPDQYIATLTDDGILNMKFIIMEGKNYFVQKSNSYLDFSLVKKREILLKELKDLLNSNNKKFDSMHYQWGLPRRKSDSKTRKSKSLRNPKDFKNASILNIDAIFNPVTKVNYILEIAENMLVNNAIEKSMFVDDLTSLISSNNVLKTNFPFLKTAFAAPLGQNNENFGQSDDNVNLSSSQALTLEDTQQNGDPVGLSPFMKGLLEYVNNFSTGEYGHMYNSLHPLRKGGSKHNIILEIWTNGSMHPRDALSNAFFNLSFLFSNFQKTKIMNPIYRNEFSFKNSLNLLNEGSDQKANFYSELLPHTNDKKNPKQNPGSFVTGVSHPKEETQSQNLNYDIRILNLSLRTYTKLKRANINKICDLSAMTENSLVNVLDKKSLTEIKRSFVDLGLNFAKDA